jgi:predicted nucleic acid-binding protein
MILAYAIIEVPDQTPPVNRLLDQELVWGAPLLWRSELRNVLLQYVRVIDERQPGAGLTLADAQRKMEVAETLIGDRSFEVQTDAVFTRAEDTGLSAYDSEYVVLAEELEVPLVTTDQEILQSAPEVTLRPSEVH